MKKVPSHGGGGCRSSRVRAKGTLTGHGGMKADERGQKAGEERKFISFESAAVVDAFGANEIERRCSGDRAKA